MSSHPAFARRSIPGYRVAVTLVACGQEKHRESRRARELYVGDLTRKQIQRAERAEHDPGSPADGVPWFIASARHGLVDPDAVIAPYDESVVRMSKAQRVEWGARVAAELLAICPGERLCVSISAGRVYADAIRPALEAAGAQVVVEMVGQQVGERKQSLKRLAVAQAEWVARWASQPYESWFPITRDGWERAQESAIEWRTAA